MTKSMVALLDELTRTWHTTIPVSGFMELKASRYENQQFTVSAPLDPNINLHHTMFAGSIYTLATLAGWGAIWLNQKLQGAEYPIVLGKAEMHYLAPVRTNAQAKVIWPDITLEKLQEGEKQRFFLTIEVYDDTNKCAVFEGKYVSLYSS